LDVLARPGGEDRETSAFANAAGSLPPPYRFRRPASWYGLPRRPSKEDRGILSSAASLSRRPSKEDLVPRSSSTSVSRSVPRSDLRKPSKERFVKTGEGLVRRPITPSHYDEDDKRAEVEDSRSDDKPPQKTGMGILRRQVARNLDDEERYAEVDDHSAPAA
jgi:hypothetical protein